MGAFADRIRGMLGMLEQFQELRSHIEGGRGSVRAIGKSEGGNVAEMGL